jgi:ATP-dependent DNA ligase I
MLAFAQRCDAVGATTKKSEKVRLVAEYLRSLRVEDAEIAAIFFTGRAFPRWEERVPSVGSSILWRAIERIGNPAEGQAHKTYLKHGDLGGMANELLAGHGATGELTLGEVASALAHLAALRGSGAKLAAVEELLRRAAALEAKYIVKIITGDLRIGLRESLVEEAIAQAYARAAADVRRANMLVGDIAATLRLGVQNELATARLQLFHPIGFMLASPVDTPAEALEYFPRGALVEDKFDGIRAQAHKSGRTVKLFSRTLDEIVEFPELHGAIAALPGEFIVDGEIVGWREERPLPFTELQKRLGRKQADMWLLQDIPASFVAFDCLYQDGELLLDEPLARRRERLASLVAGRASAQMQLAEARLFAGVAKLEEAFAGARARGHEGIMLKDATAGYKPGQRGRHWLKLKRPLATLDVVVTAVEYGHGKRHGLLSDYTFAVRDGERLLNIGKAYSGLTDAEIRAYTDYFLQHAVEDYRAGRSVEPRVVIEVAFNNIQRSRRHESGYALRFPRILRIRTDKTPAEIDTLDGVREIFEKQQSAARGE